MLLRKVADLARPCQHALLHYLHLEAACQPCPACSALLCTPGLSRSAPVKRLPFSWSPFPIMSAGTGRPATMLGPGAEAREGSFWYLSSMEMRKASLSPRRAVALYTPSAGSARSLRACRQVGCCQLQCPEAWPGL